MKMNTKKLPPFLRGGIDKVLYQLVTSHPLAFDDDLEFWIWQFMRRSDKYKRDYNRCKKDLMARLSSQDTEIIRDENFDDDVVSYALEHVSAAKKKKWCIYFREKYRLEKPCNYNNVAIDRQDFYPAVILLPQKTDNELYAIAKRRVARGEYKRIAEQVSFKVDLRYNNKILLQQFEQLITFIKNCNCKPNDTMNKMLSSFRSKGFEKDKAINIRRVKLYNENTFYFLETMNEREKDKYKLGILSWDIMKELVATHMKEHAINSNKLIERIAKRISQQHVHRDIRVGKKREMKFMQDNKETCQLITVRNPEAIQKRNVGRAIIYAEGMINGGGYKKLYDISRKIKWLQDERSCHTE